MNKKTRITTAIITILIASMAMPTIYAAEPTVSTDEAVYVNLDYYGRQSDISIVKSCNLNGNQEFTDYGSYSTVTNMTNYAQPNLTQEGVTWRLTEPVKRFYFQCTPKEEIVLPWNFDVSYRLNGVPTKAEELAGASGLVEITIDVIPNEQAKQYYKNNMLLQIATMVNMEDTNAVEAPGAQLQSMGTYKAVIFAALPGEKKTFTIRIGTDSFESEGITMMMIPGTLDQLKDIKELKEDKDKIKDAGDSAYEALDSFLTTLETMKQSLNEAKEGIRGLDDARASISATKNDVHGLASSALEKAAGMTQDLNALVPHLQNGQQLVKKLYDDINTIMDTIRDSQEQIESYQILIEQIQADVEQVQSALNDANSLSEQRQEIFNLLQDDLGKLGSGMEGIKGNSKSLSDNLEDLKKTTDRLKGITGNISSINGTLGSVADGLTGGALGGALDIVDGQLEQIGSVSVSALEDLSSVLSTTSAAVGSLKEVTEKGQSLADTMQILVALMEQYCSIVETNHDTTEDILSKINEMGDISSQTLDSINELIDNTDSLVVTLNSYEEGNVGLLEDLEKLTASMTDGMVSTLAFLNSLESFIRTNGDKIDDGTKKTLDALVSMIDKSIDGINDTDLIRTANNTIKDTIDKEIDKFEEDNRFLYLDYEQPMQSFTSDKNLEPESVQVILRTKEIQIDDDEDFTIDLEPTVQNKGVWEKIKDVFSKIWNAITGVFGN